MRDVIFVRLAHTQLVALQKLLGEACGDGVLSRYPEVTSFIENATRMFTDEDPLVVENVLARAKELYADGSDNDIEVDSDAALSSSDDGTWVQAWVWVRSEEPD